jgi:hypothetical protein
MVAVGPNNLIDNKDVLTVLSTDDDVNYLELGSRTVDTVSLPFHSQSTQLYCSAAPRTTCTSHYVHTFYFIHFHHASAVSILGHTGSVLFSLPVRCVALPSLPFTLTDVEFVSISMHSSCCRSSGNWCKVSSVSKGVCRFAMVQKTNPRASKLQGCATTLGFVLPPPHMHPLRTKHPSYRVQGSGCLFSD